MIKVLGHNRSQGFCFLDWEGGEERVKRDPILSRIPHLGPTNSKWRFPDR